MSFRCEACKTPQEPGIRPVARVVATRDRVYNTHGGDIPGSEIVKEQKICPACDGQKPMESAMAKALNATAV
jgi:hypothetical protein